MEKTIKLELTVKEVDAVLVALSEKPLKEVIDVFNKIRNESLEQLKPKEPSEE